MVDLDIPAPTRNNQRMKKLVKYLDKRLISFFQATDRDEAIRQLVEICFEEGKIASIEPFLSKVAEREKIVSTGIGMAVAIPHAKLSDFNEFFIAIGILSKGVDWHALDGHPVRIVFLIGGPDNKQTEYLQILSSLTTFIKSEELRKKMLTLNSPTAMMDLFKDF